jgi:hypothetical protein
MLTPSQPTAIVPSQVFFHVPHGRPMVVLCTQLRCRPGPDDAHHRERA